MINKHVEYSFVYDKPSTSSVGLGGGSKRIAQGMMYPKNDWFALSLDDSKESAHIKIEDWRKIVEHVEAIITEAGK